MDHVNSDTSNLVAYVEHRVISPLQLIAGSQSLGFVFDSTSK